MARHTISNSDDIIDSRAVIKRIADLESELEDTHNDAVERMRDTDFTEIPEDEHLDYTVLEDFEEWLALEADNDNDDAIELRALRALAEDASGSPDWRYGETLIRDSYFKTYAQELAEDIGAINRDATWPNMHIDWESAAEALQMDYTSVDFDGVTYWIRS